MEPQNPYSPPIADVSPQYGGTDQTSPLSPAGRFGRLSFLAWSVLFGLASNLLTFLVGGGALFFPPSPQYDGAPPAMPEIAPATLAILALVGLVAFIFYLIFSIRRCHDFNASGWWNLLLLVPFVNLIFMLVLWLRRGDEGANHYGPPRPTPTWETILGFLGVAFIVLMFVGVLAAIAIPIFVNSIAPPTTGV